MIAEKYGPTFSRQLMMRAAQSALTSAPAWIGAGGALLTIASLGASLNDISEQKAAYGKAVNALNGYTNGFIGGIFGERTGAGNPEWYSAAYLGGVQALRAQVLKVKSMPQFAAFDFSIAELETAIRAGVKQNRDVFYDTLYESFRKPIYAHHINAWYRDASDSWLERMMGSADKDKKYVLTRFGMTEEDLKYAEPVNVPESEKTPMEDD